MKKFMYTLLVSLLASVSMMAQGGVKGIVADDSGEPVIGATVMLGEDGLGTVTDYDGSFEISGVDAGTYQLVISYVGFSDTEQEVTIGNDVTDLGNLKMEVSEVGLQEIEVFASSAVDRKTPVAVSTIKAEEIQEKLGSQEFPEILKTTPSVYVTKSSGGFGDARMNIRGFTQENVALLINGISVSGMEDNKVYWSNWAGLGDVTREIQVQRGLGASKMAITSVGGTVNIVTKTTDIEKGGSVAQSIGNDGYMKTTLTLSTGRTEKGWAFTFSGSRTTGDGYIDNNYIDAWSYFASIAKEIGEGQQLSLTAFGAPQRHGQRSFEHRIGKDLDKYGIRYNDDWGTKGDKAFGWRDNFYHKPQIALNHFWQINDKVFLGSAAYVSFGHGGGTGDIGSTREYRIGRDYAGQFDFDQIVNWHSGKPNTLGLEDIPSFDPVFNYGSTEARVEEGVRIASKEAGGLIKRASMNDHNWYGLLSTVNADLTEELKLTGGIDFRFYHGNHYRKVVDLLGADYWFDNDNESAKQDWVDFNDNGIVDEDEGERGVLVRPGNDADRFWGSVKNRDKIDYHNEEQINWYGSFASLEYSKDKLSAFVSGSVSLTTMQRFEYFTETRANRDSEVERFTGYNARIGTNYNIDNNHNVFANLGYLSKAPYFDAVFYNYNNKEVNKDAPNEKILAFELGYGYRSKSLSGNLNLYRTHWNDKLERGSFTNDDGEQFNGNLQGIGAVHQGIELDLRYKATDWLNFFGMASFGDWQWKGNANASFYNDDQELQGNDSLYLDGLKIGDVAQNTFALGGDVKVLPGLKLDATYTYCSNLYTSYNINGRKSEGDNELQPMKLDNYGLLDLGLTYSFKVMGLDASARVNMNNALDKRYIAEAFDDDGKEEELNVGSPEWEAAIKGTRGWYGFGRTWNMTFKLRF